MEHLSFHYLAAILAHANMVHVRHEGPSRKDESRNAKQPCNPDPYAKSQPSVP